MLDRPLCIALLALLPFGTLMAGERVQVLGPIAVTSDGRTQWSSARYAFPIETAGTLRVRYSAAREHCSALRIHVFVDDRAATDSEPVQPGLSTADFDLGPLAPGIHHVALQAQGIEGGCNAGHLGSWGGTVVVWTADPDGGSRWVGAETLGDTIFECEHVNVARNFQQDGRYVAADGIVRTYHLSPDRARALRGFPIGDTIPLEWLLARYQSDPGEAGRVTPQELERARALVPGVLTHATERGSPRGRSADAGQSTCSIYLATAAPGQYQRVVVGGRGNVDWEHAGPEARELMQWLQHVGAATPPRSTDIPRQ